MLSQDATLKLGGTETATSLAKALALVQAEPRLFVIGGSQVYAQALPLADTLLLTEIDADLPGDVHFPAWDRSQFEARTRQASETGSALPCTFVTYRRLP